MAATDKTYRNQPFLDIVFAVSCILMLLSLVWMFAQDYYRPYKPEQRRFRDVEVAVAQRLALQDLPSKDTFDAAKKAVVDAKKERDKSLDTIRQYESDIAALEPDRERLEAAFQGFKAEHDSRMSFYNIAVDHEGPDSESAKTYLAQIQDLKAKQTSAQAERDNVVAQIRELQQKKRYLEKPLVDAQSRLKKVTDDFEIQVKTSFDKQWTIYDTIRNIPIIDGFADPIKIKQFTIEDIPIDYNFKYVTRFDRCMSCHLGIERPAYTPEMLTSLSKVTKYQSQRLKDARSILKDHLGTLEGLPEAANIPDPDTLNLETLELTKERVKEYCAHPRLDLFVGANSKHPAERFGCTSCHRGQGSATEFSLAAHVPNNVEEKHRWIDHTNHGYDASSQHFWDFPMLPSRFIEASCIKCHHEVTDLISVDNRIEAPKLMRGYEIIREVGCFGCHEIKGRKYNRPIGPDLRLEPTPPLEEMTAAEKDRLLSDPENLPGELRKVGPSLYRLSEKTNKDFVVKWLRSPRSFRPDTRMPHFYGLANNSPEVLPDAQKKFPDAEINAVAHFLFLESEKYLDKVMEHQKDDAAKRQADLDLANALTIRSPSSLSEEEKTALAEAQWRIRYRKATPRFQSLSKDYKGDAGKGRELFATKGCLACHRHDSMTRKEGDSPAIDSEAQHGPDLSQIAEKLGKAGDKETARVWLMNWIKNPHNYSPRTKMPVVSMTDNEIIDVTAWLLSQKAVNIGTDWNELQVPAPEDKTLRDLADVYLVRQLSEVNLKKLKKDGRLDKMLVQDLPADERKLAESYNTESVRYYVGKKAVSRLGCFGCHDVPGFDDAKSIGVGLNDWGKRDPTRLAFEDIVHYVKKNYIIVDSMTKEKKVDGEIVHVPQPFKKVGKNLKKPYEKFFFDKLAHHDRIGFLHQKLTAPRSYDFNRIRGENGRTLKAWDDLARMPQFRFARTIRKKGESDKDYAQRRWHEEAEAREEVMTFILGLVAEKVPLKSLYQPTGDRLAQVRGRQVLQTFNCAGCHTVRPGQYEFKLGGENEKLFALAARLQKAGGLNQDFNFYDHNAWSAAERKTTKGFARAFGIPAQIKGPKGRPIPDIRPDPEDESKQFFALRLTEAFRFHQEDGTPENIRAAQSLLLRPSEMTFPPPEVFESVEKFQEFEKKYGAYGGAFADLLTQYLIDRYPSEYKVDQSGDNSFARASAPPPLIGQGGRTQPGWLFQFLLNPQPVRKMVVLRMPRFNLSRKNAQALVDYFTAVSRQTNPRFQVTEGAPTMPQKVALDEPYWRQRTADYVEYLKSTKGEGGMKTLYDERLALLKPLWQQVGERDKAQLADAKENYKGYADQMDAINKAVKDAAGKLNKGSDKEKKAALKAFTEANQKKTVADKSLLPLVTAWKNRVEALEKKVKNSTPEKMQQNWEQEQAYVIDGFRLLANPEVCAKCHQVGPSIPSQKEQGPALAMAQNRLRPDWIIHWVARPNRMVTYPSPMIPYFPKDQTQHQHLLAGTPKEQLRAVVDALMYYDRAIESPLSLDLIYPAAKGKKK